LGALSCLDLVGVGGGGGKGVDFQYLKLLLLLATAANSGGNFSLAWTWLHLYIEADKTPTEELNYKTVAIKETPWKKEDIESKAISIVF
jgi:hypothetical protein